VKAGIALVLATVASLALAQAPAKQQTEPAELQKSRKAQPARKAAKERRAHKRATREQIRRFKELEKKKGRKR